jgi:hypothetical protein
VATLFLDHYVKRFGLPTTIVCDRDPKFTGIFWKQLMHSLGVKHNMSTARHPQTDGQSERTNQTVEQILRSYCAYNQQDWAKWLSLAEFAINDSVNDSTGFTPFFADTGQHPNRPTVAHYVPGASSEVAEKLQLTMKHINSQLQKNILAAQAHQKKYADKKRKLTEFNIGDQVMLSAKGITAHNQGSNASLRAKFLGPFTVVGKRGVVYRLQLPPEMKIHPVFHVSLLKKYLTDRTPGRSQPRPRPIQCGDTLEYEVDRILRHRRYRKQIQFLTKWKGLPDHETSWEPYASFMDDDGTITEALQEYLANNKL